MTSHCLQNANVSTEPTLRRNHTLKQLVEPLKHGTLKAMGKKDDAGHVWTCNEIHVKTMPLTMLLMLVVMMITIPIKHSGFNPSEK